jgi:hypothetical protein
MATDDCRRPGIVAQKKHRIARRQTLGCPRRLWAANAGWVSAAAPEDRGPICNVNGISPRPESYAPPLLAGLNDSGGGKPNGRNSWHDEAHG